MFKCIASMHLLKMCCYVRIQTYYWRFENCSLAVLTVFKWGEKQVRGLTVNIVLYKAVSPLSPPETNKIYGITVINT